MSEEPSLVPPHTRTIVELGSGDCRLLEALAEKDPETVYIGIELDGEQCRQAKSRINLQNVFVMQGSFEDIVPRLPDDSVDGFIAVLPDPAFIDEKREDKWKPLYRAVYAKLKRPGAFRLVTEITDELLQPVSNEAFDRWSIWLVSAFHSVGFKVAGMTEGSPVEYSSRCIDQFRGDPERIRMATLDFVKE
ncbi:methyltransferase domain-containing protein [Nitrososphaera viennensis]|uniref:tRNA (guanine(46)-N(7))-methyltransferase n=2 Tax=Nitrososphaera viennensis TaxID=1034015 RepID=A0A060HKH3_9ARCH|nr:methyltransferase domain-containing protein [Nitrososphaera viennensis]AIC17014.1 putative tRNA (guanine-N(7)-)-methyltransferase [Nitrososphaera viennensis EN76]UVS68913.1 methyltransferase domain-containing protein [Nitrososphaera viennensis]